MELNFKPRKSQEQILQYTGGLLGISAVPGSGKTHVLSALAAKLLVEDRVNFGQEILIVTLVNSAVENFSTRIERFVKDNGLFPNTGYRVRTLHGLAFDILKEDPSLVGLDSGFSIIDEKEGEQIRSMIVKRWIQNNEQSIDLLLRDDLSQTKKAQITGYDLGLALEKFALAFIKTAKDVQLTPELLQKKCVSDSPLLLKIGYEMFEQYYFALSGRGILDFDDLIALAFQALESSPELTERLQNKFSYILEDEAQDSSQTQEKILRKISNGNWVRVGDTNQAIYETFTTASPKYLIDFIQNADQKVDLPESGRCQPSIIKLANDLISWTMNEHPIEMCRDALRPPFIIATSPEDPQQNPLNKPDKVILHSAPFNSSEELNTVAKSAGKYVKDNPQKTIAVLSTTNKRGIELIELLKQLGIPFVENLNSTSETRTIISRINIVLSFLNEPTSIHKMRKAIEVLTEKVLPADVPELNEIVLNAIKVMKEPEDIFDLAFSIKIPVLDEAYSHYIQTLINKFKIWMRAILLPVDQIILLVGQDLYFEPHETALIHKIAFHIRQGLIVSREWGLKESIQELSTIAANQKKFIGFSSEDTNFDPDLHPGKVMVSTIHKAKGLEWDKVIVMSVNNYDFPGMQEGDTYYSEKWFLHGGLNLEAEGIDQLRNLIKDNYHSSASEIGKNFSATEKARNELVKERLRVLYVAITRAREELVLTWNTGRQKNLTPSIAFRALANKKES